jgi:protein SCO1
MAYRYPVPATRVSRKRRQWLFAIGLMPWLAACDQISKRNVSPFKGIDITGAPYGRDFELTDHRGQRRTLADYRGKVIALFFGFTQCPDICPTTLADMAAVRAALGADAAAFQVLFVTVDPKRDTQPLLAQYVPAFDASFVGLFGDAAATDRVAREFKIYYREVEGKTPQSYTVDHSSQLYLLDRSGRLRLMHMHGAPKEKIVADVKTLLATT